VLFNGSEHFLIESNCHFNYILGKRFRPVSLNFDPQKIATEFILRLKLSLYIYKFYLKNLEKSKHVTSENNKTVLYRFFYLDLL